MDLLRRSVTSVAWNSVANLVSIAILLVRSILLARWLEVETFGVYAGATAVIALTSTFAGFGMGGAFLNRVSETKDENHAASSYFTLLMILSSVWVLIMMVGALIFSTGPTQTALITLTLTTFVLYFASVPQQILVRRVVHRRLALIQLTTSLSSTVVALVLASLGFELWSLLATDITAAIVANLMVYTKKRVWTPKIIFKANTIRYFLQLGSKNVLAAELSRLLDRFDDIWTRLYLGTSQLGYYSRAYTFATYPRTIIATPVNRVITGVYAELKEDRKRLSQAFFRTNALLVRIAFFLGGLLALIAPEFIRLILGEKWIPMLAAFRLMLIFTLLDPIKITISNLFVAVGTPQKVIWARLIQFVILVGGLFLFGREHGIVGVAIAVDLMLFVGLMVLFFFSKRIVDTSLIKLFFVPLIGLSLGLGLARLGLFLPGVIGSDLRTGLVKIFIFLPIYTVILYIMEKNEIKRIGRLVHLRFKNA